MRSIKSFFPKKVKSLDNFVEILKEEGTDSILIEPQMSGSYLRYFYSIGWIGWIGDFYYSLKLTTTTLSGKKIIYKEKLFKRFGTVYGFSDSDERRNSAIKILLLTEKRAKDLQAKFPSVSVSINLVNVILRGNQYMDNKLKLFEQLHKEALACGVAI